MEDKPYLLDGEIYQYSLGWLVKKLLSFENDLATAIDLKTIKYADPFEWDITTQYTANTVVIDPKTGVAYMSKVPVPVGIDLDNLNYWVRVFDFLAIYNRIMDGVATNERRNNYASRDYAVNDLVWYSEILYRVTKTIPEGSKFIPNTNLAATTIESCLERYYGKDRFAQVLSEELHVSGALTVTAGDVSLTTDNVHATLTGDYTVTAGDIARTGENITDHSTGDYVTDTDGDKTETIDGANSLTIGKDYTVEVGENLTEHVTKNREIDVDGTDSYHVDGSSTVNVGGLRTETYAGAYGKTVNGAVTETFKSSVTKTIAGKTVVNATDYTFTNSNTSYNIKNARHTVKDYGAKGDGKTDDSAAIMKMISAEGYAVIPSGIFKCNLTIETANVTIMGYNRYSSVLSAFDTTKDVVQVTKAGAFFGAQNVQFQNGLNGLHIIEGIGNSIVDCTFRTNTNYGYYQDKKNSTLNSELTHIRSCYAERNGIAGYYFSDYPDWAMSECEGVSNASAMNASGSANLKVYGNCAGKVVNSHFWNYNDYFGYFRPQTSVSVQNAYVEFTNCHIEGGYECVLTLSKSPSCFVNCLFYASFGAYAIWISDSAQASFIGCTFNGQAADNADYKPNWVAIFNGNSTKGVIQGCWIYGKIFANSNFTGWTIDARGTNNDANALQNVGVYTDLKFQSDAMRRNVNALIGAGGTTMDLTKFNSMYITGATVTFTGAPYNGQQVVLANSTAANTVVTAPTGYTFMGVGSKLTIPSHKAVICIFTTDTIYTIGL